MARTKSFQIEDALDQAMRIFWAQGYGQTSMQDLVSKMGINRQSIYDTFGDKHALFLRVLDHYRLYVTALYTNQAKAKDLVLDKIAAIFETAAFPTPANPPGCLIVNTMTELSALDPQVNQKMTAWLHQDKRRFKALLQTGQRQQELPTDLNTDAVADYINNAFVGIRVLAKTNPSPQSVAHIIRQTLSLT